MEIHIPLYYKIGNTQNINNIRHKEQNILIIKNIYYKLVYDFDMLIIFFHL